MLWKIDLIFLELNKVEMVDAWTQTSNNGNENDGQDVTNDTFLPEEHSISTNKNIDLSSYPSTLVDSPLSLFK